MAPKSVTFRRHDHLVSVLFGDLLSHSYNITFSMFLDLVTYAFVYIQEQFTVPKMCFFWCACIFGKYVCFVHMVPYVVACFQFLGVSLTNLLL